MSNESVFSTREPGRWCCAALLILTIGTLAVAVALPILADLLRTDQSWTGLRLSRAGALALFSSAVYAVLIGTLATALGWSIAGVLSRRGWAAGLMLLPVLLPSYLAYAGWGQLRAPGTLLGDWLLNRSAAGDHWWPIFAGRLFAVLGLALWATPIAGLIMASGRLRRGGSFDEALALDRASPVRRTLERFRFHRADLFGSAAVISLIMLGSAIPLHVAQVPTFAIELWLNLAETAPSAWGTVWASAWPMVLIAMLAGWILGGLLVRPAPSDIHGGQELATPSRASSLSGWAVWTLAVVIPTALCAINLSGWSVFETLWRLDRAPLITSLTRGALLGLGLTLIAGAVSVLISSGRPGDRALVRGLVRVSLVLGLLPGFLIGAAISRSGLQGDAAPVLAHAARFGFVGVLGGVWACRAESAQHRAVRSLDSGGSIAGWAVSVLPGQWQVLVAVGLAGAALSLHEIEATVFVEPPGSGSLAQKMLGHLHFARMDELNAMSLVIVGVGLIPSLICAFWILQRPLATEPNRTR